VRSTKLRMPRRGGTLSGVFDSSFIPWIVS
jgi:hypothetical protein